MSEVRLGRTEIVSGRNAFGGLPIQLVSHEEAARVVRKAFENGFTFFDTGNSYTDSEEKLGLGLEGIRDKVIIATKTKSKSAPQFWEHLNTSLKRLRTDYIDVYQFHNPAVLPRPDDGTGMYEAMLEAKEKGLIKHIGISNHRIAVAEEAVESGLYDVVQFPFSYLADEREHRLVERCKELDVGFVAMKGLAGGIIDRVEAAYAYIAQFDNVLPIWGIEQEWQLDQFIECAKNPPVMTEELEEFIARERVELAGDFCRGCGYCLPCPEGIQINNCARVGLQIRRSPKYQFVTDAFRAEMDKVKNCRKCGLCHSRCPYGLDTPALLEKHLAEYEEYYARYKANEI